MQKKIRIESLGVYLPEKTVTTEELMASCRRRPGCDFERITGIRERRVAEGEYASDLAIGAARRWRAVDSGRRRARTRSHILVGNHRAHAVTRKGYRLPVDAFSHHWDHDSRKPVGRRPNVQGAIGG